MTFVKQFRCENKKKSMFIILGSIFYQSANFLSFSQFLSALTGQSTLQDASVFELLFIKVTSLTALA